MSDREKSPVIIVTDGDSTAWDAVREACQDLGLYPLRKSRGNPTPLDGDDLVEAIRKAPEVPVVVMVDDQGESGKGAGEEALGALLHAPEIQVLGVVAVASHTPHVEGVHPWFSITRDGARVEGAVDKGGRQQGRRLRGDTVDVIDDPDLPVVGLGDPGKMGGEDAARRGSPSTREALRAILERAGLEPTRGKRGRGHGR